MKFVAREDLFITGSADKVKAFKLCSILLKTWNCVVELNYLAVAINHKKVKSSHTDMLLHLVENIVKSKLHISLSMDEAAVDIKF